MIEKNQHRFRYIQLLNQSAINQMMLKDYKAAETTLSEAVNESNEHEYRYMSSSIYLNLGICNMRMKELEKSLEFYDKALSSLKSIDCQHSILAAKVSGSKANCLALMGDLENAATTIHSTMQNYRASGNELQYHTHAVNLADVLIELSKFEEAETLLDQAIGYFEKTASHGYLQNAHLCKARCYEVQLRFQEAFGSMEDLHQASQKYFRENFAKQTLRFQNRIEELRTEYQLLKSRYSEQDQVRSTRTSNKLLGEHPQIKKALSEAMLAARHPYANVIIQGESGTGKEVLARIIHYANTQDKPLVAINAAAISPSLIESELFGHVKGSFTGAVSDYKGKFLMANGGTLFLDEISEMPLEVQTKLLRAIEYQTITPVGSNKEYAVKCRIICATNVKLSRLIRSNKFRLDLYHRLNKVEICLPALRERISDLELLTRHFSECIAQEQGLPVPEISGSFFDRLRKYSFPGNIRELRNIIERIFILRFRHFWDAEVLEGLLLDEHDIKQDIDYPMTDNLDKVEYTLILNALNQCNWVQKDAAKILRISESTLTRHMQKLGISRNKL
jgi:DNA-binding NtrC family response regulator